MRAISKFSNSQINFRKKKRRNWSIGFQLMDEKEIDENENRSYAMNRVFHDRGSVTDVTEEVRSKLLPLNKLPTSMQLKQTELGLYLQ